MRLASPDPRWRASFIAALHEHAADGRPITWRGRPLDPDALTAPEAFAHYVAAVLAEADEDAPRPDGYVPSTTHWYVDGDEYVGRVSIRHRLTDHLREVGGHIGYDVRPSRRRQGHATSMLRDALPTARALGIDPALVTCDASNTASRRVIEKNGGVLEDQRGDKLRFWVPTRS